jgi:hypothetical protein
MCMCLFCVYVVLCLGRGLATSWSLVQKVLPSVKWSWNWKIRGQGPRGLWSQWKKKKNSCGPLKEANQLHADKINVVPVRNQLGTTPWRCRCTDQHFLYLDISWRDVVSFRPRPLYPRGNSPLYPFDWRLGGPQSQSVRRGEDKILDLTGTQTPTRRSFSP